MYIARRKTVIRGLIVLASAIITFVYILIKIAVIQKPNSGVSVIIACHYELDSGSLPSIEYITPPPDSIFFHETSCRRGMTPRQACSVESVARIHPERNVYVFFNSPITEIVLKRSCLAKLLEFENVKLARLHTFQYARNTAIAELLAHDENIWNEWPVEHAADLLRFITLYKYGGVYLDTDTLVVKRLDVLGRNWVGKERDNSASIGAMAISRDKSGHYLVKTILNEIKTDFQPRSWTHNGAGALQRALVKLCNTSDVTLMSAATCRGFKFYEPEKIYPVRYTDNAIYFKPGDLPNTIVEEAYTHHFWNLLTWNLTLEKDSPYDKLAWMYCPTIREFFYDDFGVAIY